MSPYNRPLPSSIQLVTHPLIFFVSFEQNAAISHVHASRGTRHGLLAAQLLLCWSWFNRCFLLFTNFTFWLSVTAPGIQVLAPWSWGHIQGKTEYIEDTTPPSVWGRYQNIKPWYLYNFTVKCPRHRLSPQRRSLEAQCHCVSDGNTIVTLPTHTHCVYCLNAANANIMFHSVMTFKNYLVLVYWAGEISCDDYSKNDGQLDRLVVVAVMAESKFKPFTLRNNLYNLAEATEYNRV